MAQLYGKKTSDGRPKALECTDEGLLKVDTELTATIDPAGLATEATLADLLAKIIAAPSTEAKQDLIITALGLIGTEATTGDIKTSSASIDGKLPALVGGKVPVVAEVTPKVQLHTPIDFSSASAQTIIDAPSAGNRVRLTRLSLMSGGTPQVNVEIALKSAATLLETVKGATMAFDYPEHRNLGTNEAFVVQCTTADRVIGGVDYYVEAV